MAINHEDGQFQLAYWFDESRCELEPDDTEYSDNGGELRDRAPLVLRHRRFKFAVLFRWNGTDWDEVEQFRSSDCI